MNIFLLDELKNGKHLKLFLGGMKSGSIIINTSNWYRWVLGLTKPFSCGKFGTWKQIHS